MKKDFQIWESGWIISYNNNVVQINNKKNMSSCLRDEVEDWVSATSGHAVLKKC